MNRVSLVPLLMLAAFATPAQAADGSSPAAPSATASSGPMTVRQELMNALSKQGYTDIDLMPTSFLVHAKDAKGRPVAIVVGPDSVTEVTEVAAPAGSPASQTQDGKALSPDQIDAFLAQYGKDGTLSVPQADTAAEARFDALDLKHTGKVDQKELVPAGVDTREFDAVNPDKDTTLEKDEYLNLVRRKFNAANAKHGEALTKAELGTPAGQALMRLLH